MVRPCGIGKPEAKSQMCAFGLRLEPVFGGSREFERRLIGHHAVGKARQKTGARGLIGPGHLEFCCRCTDFLFPEPGFGQRRINPELRQGLSPGAVDAEVVLVGAVAELFVGGAGEKLRKDMVLTDVAAVFPALARSVIPRGLAVISSGSIPMARASATACAVSEGAMCGPATCKSRTR